MISGIANIGALIWGGSFLVCIFFAAEILRSTRPEQSIAAWILLFLLIPPVGAALYLVLGRRKLRRRAGRKPTLTVSNSHTASKPINLFDALVRSYGLPAPTNGNDVVFYGTGDKAYAAIANLIDTAQHSLWISIYILRADPIGRDIVHRLSRRAAEGVQVRLLVDDIGSPDARNEQFIGPLIEKGGMVSRFMKVSFLPKSRHYSNLRNHRKMIVADQCRAWSGGMNLSELYLGDSSIKGFFYDLSFIIHGPAAAVYSSIFAADWAFSAGEKLILNELVNQPATEAGSGVVQIVPAGPEMEGDTVYDLILTMVNRAERKLWVVSPYFIPDVGLMRAFRLAAKRGVDVRFLTNLASDLALMDFAAIVYLRALALAGGRVFRFSEGMIHAKALVIDDSLAFAGTTNLDQRSLFLNFEVMALFHDPSDAQIIVAWIEKYFDRSKTDLPPATPVRQIAEGFVRLFGPVL